MANYSHDRIVPFKDSELGKKQQIAAMFDKIAFRYDFLNRFLSGGIDIYWRRRAIREVGAGIDSNANATKTDTPRPILDVATGTGDMAIMMARYLPAVRVTGVDISTGMLEIGRQKITRAQVQDKVNFPTGDSEPLKSPDGSFN